MCLTLGACRRTNCDGIRHPANVATCARMALCPISFKIRNFVHLNSLIYCAKEHFLCFCLKYNAKTYAICTEFHINCTKHSFINWHIHRQYFKKLHSEVHDLHNATTFGSHRLQWTWMYFDHIALNFDVMPKNRNVQYRFFLHSALFVWLLENPEEIKK
jgi:hypothetical protein